MNRTTARILGGALLIALVAAGTPLAQTLRIARTAATAEKRAETRLLLPSEWNAQPAHAGSTETGTSHKPETPLPPQLLKPLSEQWDTARSLLLPAADLPETPGVPLEQPAAPRISSDLTLWLPQTDPPDWRSRGPPA